MIMVCYIKIYIEEKVDINIKSYHSDKALIFIYKNKLCYDIIVFGDISMMIDSKKFYIPASFVGDSDYIRPSSILDLFQTEATIHADTLKLGYEDMLKRNLLWIVSYQEIDIVGKLPIYCDEVVVSTWPHERKRLEYVREYEIRDLDDNLLVCGIASWFTIDLNKRTLVKDDNVNYVGDFYQNTYYPNFRRKKLELVPQSEIIKWDYVVTYTDLDHNGHMNNAKYLDIIYNKHLNDLSKIRKIMISFNHEIKLGETVNMEFFKNKDNDFCYIGYVNSEKCFEVIIKEES